MPLFNSEAFIELALHSVQNQSLKDWELLIVDDASTDSGAEIAESIAGADPRIKLIRMNSNAGAGAARNAGIAASSGRYIAFLDSDDLWLPDKLEKQIKFMEVHQTSFTFTDYEKITESGGPTGRIVRCKRELKYSVQLKTNFVGCSTAIYDSLYFGKRYFPVIRKRQDYALWLDLLSDGTIGKGLSESLTLYRIRTGGLSGNKLALIRYNWLLYRDVLGLSPAISAYYLLWNVAIKLFFRR